MVSPWPADQHALPLHPVADRYVLSAGCREGGVDARGCPGRPRARSPGPCWLALLVTATQWAGRRARLSVADRGGPPGSRRAAGGGPARSARRHRARSRGSADAGAWPGSGSPTVPGGPGRALVARAAARAELLAPSAWPRPRYGWRRCGPGRAAPPAPACPGCGWRPSPTPARSHVRGVRLAAGAASASCPGAARGRAPHQRVAARRSGPPLRHGDDLASGCGQRST